MHSHTVGRRAISCTGSTSRKSANSSTSSLHVLYFSQTSSSESTRSPPAGPRCGRRIGFGIVFDLGVVRGREGELPGDAGRAGLSGNSSTRPRPDSSGADRQCRRQHPRWRGGALLGWFVWWQENMGSGEALGTARPGMAQTKKERTPAVAGRGTLWDGWSWDSDNKFRKYSQTNWNLRETYT